MLDGKYSNLFATRFTVSLVCDSRTFYTRQKHVSSLLNMGEISFMIIKFPSLFVIDISHWACSNVRYWLNVRKDYKQQRCT